MPPQGHTQSMKQFDARTVPTTSKSQQLSLYSLQVQDCDNLVTMFMLDALKETHGLAGAVPTEWSDDATTIT